MIDAPHFVNAKIIFQKGKFFRKFFDNPVHGKNLQVFRIEIREIGHDIIVGFITGKTFALATQFTVGMGYFRTVVTVGNKKVLSLDRLIDLSD